MKWLMILVLLAYPAWANEISLVDCEEQYNSCVSQCCTSCGSDLGEDENGNLVCDADTDACASACSHCSADYTNCISQPEETTRSASCCTSAAILGGILGLVLFKRF